MSAINLTAKNPNETIILNYLKENASDALVERINGGKKTLADCWKYITSEAKKKAKNGCACIEDRVVFGWAIHFFEEDDIKGEDIPNEPYTEVSTGETEQGPAPQPKPKKKKETAQNFEQLGFEALFGDF